MGKSRLGGLKLRGAQLDQVEHKVTDLVKHTRQFLLAIQELANTPSRTEQSPTAAQKTPRPHQSSQSSIQTGLSSESKVTTQQQSATSLTTPALPDSDKQTIRDLYAEKLALSLDNINTPEEDQDLDQIATRQENERRIEEIENEVLAICSRKPNLHTLRLDLATDINTTCKNRKMLIAAEEAIKAHTKSIISHTDKLVNAAALFHETVNLVLDAYCATDNPQDYEKAKERETKIAQNLVIISSLKESIIENLKTTAKLRDEYVVPSTTPTVDASKAVFTKHQTKMVFRRTMFLRSVAATLAGIALLAALASNPAGWALGVMIAVGTVLAASGALGMTLATRSRKTSRIAPSDGDSFGESPTGSSHVDTTEDIVTVKPAARATVSFTARCCALLTCGQFKSAKTTSQTSERDPIFEREFRDTDRLSM